MNTSGESLRSAASPPFIFGSDMLGSLDREDPDFEFFDCNQFDAATSSPGIFLTEESAVDGSQFLGACGSPNLTSKSPRPTRPSPLDTKVQSLSTPSTISPTESDRDSSSDSSKYKRNLSSNSSPSAGDTMTGDSTMGGWMGEEAASDGAPDFHPYDGTINPSAMDVSFDYIDKAMENDFDFESASTSPSPLRVGSVDMDSPGKSSIRHDPLRRNSAAFKSKPRRHIKQNPSAHSTNGFLNTGSREASPLSAMVTSHESSPTTLFNNSPSPSTAIEFYHGKVPDVIPPSQPWNYFGFPQNGLSVAHHGLPNMSIPMAKSQPFPGMGSPFALLIHPTPLKSRVETQIPIKLSLFPMPLGVKKLHLPTHTISKPKLLARPAPDPSPDTLELYTTLVCTSAMRNPEYRQRAFARAAAATRDTVEEPLSESADEDDENKPLNGGDVKICVGCITRERKRAARKKIKKVEEEESWHKDEARRVVVFNAQEIKDWQPPTSQSPSEATGDRPDPFIPEGAMQVDAPMRIACYCRHQNEKLGFQVIFTIKDYQGLLLAQEITNSIMITDDHKTHNLPPPARASIGSDGQPSATAAYPMDNAYYMTSQMGNSALPRASPSADLQSIQNLNMQFQNPSDLASSHPSQGTSSTITPRMSRQTSPSTGPTSKKRKASGVPSGLAMTKLETPDAGINLGIPQAMSATPSIMPSTYSSNLQSFSPSADPPSAHPGSIQQYNNSPMSPDSNDQFSNANRSQSMDNLAMQHQMFSAPPSSHPSRTSSPNGLRISAQVYQQQQAQFAQAVANGLYSVPLSLNPQRPPTIHKLIPNEGPRAGGIEVTCLGSGFSQGLEVMFGDAKATTTTYWGETSLVCLLPPSAFAGTVPVTFKHQHQQAMQSHFPSPIPKQQAYFKYVDDDEQQIIRTALSVLGHKMTGKMEDVRDLARRIVGDGNSAWGLSSSGSGGQNQNMSSFNSASFGVDVEATLLRCLDLIDLDDSPNMPRLNLRRSSGQTMLHLACSLGLHRFVAALLARGANPDPRDKGGFTPMHFAALHNHPQIVRRLVLSGADPMVRSLQGYTPSDMATSEEVHRAARRIEHHRRTRSASSLKSRASSATSLRSVWESASAPSLDRDNSSSEDSDDDKEYEAEDANAPNDDAFWMRTTRRPSTQKSRKESVVDKKDPILELPPDIGPTGGLVSPAAAMAAFRDQLTAHIQHLQQTMHLNLPNLPQLPPLPPMPTLAMMPALPDYQAYLPTAPMVRRIGNLVGNRGEQDYKWWDLFSGTVAAAPPAYEDIFPEDTKRASAAVAAADTVADNKCAELFDQTETSSAAESSTSVQKPAVKLDTVRIGPIVTKEQQDQLRLAHAEKVKRLSRDRNLFFIWIPLLVVIILAMLFNRVPKLLSRAPGFDLLRNRQAPERVVEAL